MKLDKHLSEMGSCSCKDPSPQQGGGVPQREGENSNLLMAKADWFEQGNKYYIVTRGKKQSHSIYYLNWHVEGKVD